MNRTWNEMYGIDPAVTISDEDRKAVDEKFAHDPERNRAASEIRPPTRMQLVAYLPMMVLFIAGAIAVTALRWPFWTVVPFAIAAVVCMAYGSRWLAQQHYGLLVRRELRACGYDICIHCGYWLKALSDGVRNCPECGRPRDKARA